MSNLTAANEVIAGLDLGGTKMLGVLVDGEGVVRERLRRPTTMRGDAEVQDGVLDFLGALIGHGVHGVRTVGVGGGMAQMGALLLDPVRAATHRYVLPNYRDSVPILASALKGDAGAIGAAWALRTHGMV